jgi:hypothetical protein
VSLPGVAEYVGQSLGDGALGFYLSSNHFSGDPHNGSTIPYPQWYHKEFHPALGGVAPTLSVEVTVRELPGDYNLDGTVDGADYSVWRDQLGTATALPNDDTPGVGNDDYARWKTNFGATLFGAGAAAAATVPEPATCCILVAALAFLGSVRFRKRSA